MVNSILMLSEIQSIGISEGKKLDAMNDEY